MLFGAVYAIMSSFGDAPPRAMLEGDGDAEVEGTYLLQPKAGAFGRTFYNKQARLYLYERASDSWVVGKTNGGKSCKAYQESRGWFVYCEKRWLPSPAIKLRFAAPDETHESAPVCVFVCVWRERARESERK